MTVDTFFLVALIAIATARAFILIGQLTYTMRWLNYPISLCAAFCGAWLTDAVQTFHELPLLAAVASAAVTLFVYHLLRVRFVLANS